MANRSFERGFYALEVNPVKLWCEITFGATGAPTLTRGQGVASVARASTGKFTITLSDKYNYFLGCSITGYMSGVYSGVKWDLDDQSVASAKTVKIIATTPDGAGTVWDPPSTSKAFVTIDVRNSSVS